MSDQNSRFSSKPIVSTDRDSTYVLDEILDNETELPLLEHTTDTNGFSDLIFGLFALLGLRFSPRLKDIGEQKLYRLGRIKDHPALKPLLKTTINRRLIVQYWDELLRLAGSLKFGQVSASLLVSKLQAFPQRNMVAKALVEYGRLVKTLFILRYLESETLRHSIEGQLNKGERLHDLQHYIFYANYGQIRKHTPEEAVNQLSCLDLAVNCVVVWNTVYMQAVAEQVRAEGVAVNDSTLARLSPSRFEHINPYGYYSFDEKLELSPTKLRPLRSTGLSSK